METWQRQIAESVTTGHALAAHAPIDARGVDRVAAVYPMRIPPYWLEQIRDKDDPFYRQAVPSEDELRPCACEADPFGENRDSPVPGLVHRYPDRVLLLVTEQCAVFCRHCMRKRRSSPRTHDTGMDVNGAVAYIAAHPKIREVILSGGASEAKVADDRVAGVGGRNSQ